ncbi:hypothetical protein [Nonomuraea sp. NPDC049695]|uniref:hypothetical protein n=1 Tax=Nonomuraea sp. NPDC049695 TaxID=3154734 RepID=UPI003432C022
MPQEPRNRRGFIRAAGLLAGGTALAAAGTVGPAEASTAALSAERLRTVQALEETVAALFPAFAESGSPSARYAAASPAERARLDQAIDAVGHELATLDGPARIACLNTLLNGPAASDVETVLALTSKETERGRLLARALRAAGSARAATPAMTSPFVV